MVQGRMAGRCTARGARRAVRWGRWAVGGGRCAAGGQAPEAREREERRAAGLLRGAAGPAPAHFGDRDTLKGPRRFRSGVPSSGPRRRRSRGGGLWGSRLPALIGEALPPSERLTSELSRG